MLLFTLYIILIYLGFPALTLTMYYLDLLIFLPHEVAIYSIVNSISGVFLFYWLSAGLVTGSRPKILDRMVGLPKVMKFHILIAIGCFFWLILHFVIKGISPSLQTSFGIFAAGIFLFLFFSAALQWVDIPITKYLIKIPVIRTLHEKSHQKSQYQHQRFKHNFMVLAALLAFIHVSLSSMSLGEPRIFRLYYLIVGYFIFVLITYLKHKIIKPIWLKRFRQWKLVNIIAESSEVTSLQFEIPKRYNFKYKAGQFGFLRFTSGKLKGEEHPFSFSSNPKEDYLQLTIQKEGDFTNKISHELKTGDKAIIDGPYGKFYLGKKYIDKPLLFIAGGIGIAPFIGILKGFIENPPIQNIKLYWMIKPVNLFLHDLMQKLEKIPNIEINYFSRSNKKPLQDFTSIKDIRKRSVFVCASAEVTKNTITMLEQAGVKKRKIHTELFSMA